VNQKDKQKLTKAVQDDNLQRWLRPLMNRLEIQQEKLLRVTDIKEENELKEVIQSIEMEMERIK
jgi:hypothetical protein